MPNPDIVGPASLVVSQSFSAFQFFLPKLSDVRRADPVNNPDIVGDVRMGEVGAITLAVGVGAILSNLTGSVVPSFVAFIMVAVLVCLYEAALRGDKPGNPVIKDMPERRADA